MQFLGTDFAMCTVGPRHSGKTVLTKYMLRDERFIDQYDVIKICCPSLDFNHDYDEFKTNPKFEFYSKPTEKQINKIIETQEEVQRRLIKRARATEPVPRKSTSD